MSEPTARLVVALADRYRIERELGQGGMATVYLAQDLKHDRRVAIKVLKPELAAVLGAERFVQEIKTTAALSHPHILPLFDSGEAAGFLYYVMPYIEGETIREKLNRETQFGVEEAVRITREVADALDYAHRHGVIHRDIKPENILLHDGRAMVMDFGIALAVSAAAGGRMTETGLSLGTPHYMSPEQATAEKTITGRSDIYSLASVLFEMLTGNPPHTGATAQQIIMKIIAEPVPRVTTLRASVPPNVAASVTKALEKLPADRFETARAFEEALGNPHFAPTGLIGAAEGVPAVTSSRGWRFGGLVASALVGAAAMWLALRALPVERGTVSFTQRTFLRESIYAARWAADNKTILYTSNADGDIRIRIIHAEYPEPEPFGPDSSAVLAVSSASEVALLLHARRVATRLVQGTLARMSIGGGAPRELVEKVQGADWSPDGSQLAILRNAGDHDQLEYPIGKVLYSGPSGSYLSDIRFSSDGKAIAFFFHPTRYDDRGYVEIVRLDGTIVKDDEEYSALEGLAWSADGRALLFTAALEGPFEIRRWESGHKSVSALPGPGRLTMCDVREGRWLVARDDILTPLVAKAPGATGVRDIGWLDGSNGPIISADGEMVAFTDYSSVGGALYGVLVRRLDGAAAVRLGDGSALDISNDKRWVLAELPTSPPQYRLYPTGPGAARNLTWPRLARIEGVGFMPDSKTLYLCGNEPDRPPRCYRSALEGGEVTPMTPDGVTGEPRPDLAAVVMPRDGKWWVYPMDGSPRREIPGLTEAPIRWGPDGTALWVFRPGPPGHRGVDRVDVSTGRRTPLLDVEELRDITTPVVSRLSIADNGRSYVYTTSTYHSLLFSVEGIK